MGFSKRTGPGGRHFGFFGREPQMKRITMWRIIGKNQK
jgi:hypothetical protein